ncbi:MAG: LytTR family transcriptional regulator DNA-binding domain-containing protein [Muribaculaceae bacterium]|nr:LytTR family transcriptional regulator DNA-binding domain-containing protein [Roseburia sp.]MCM1431373.1 LytTR family transcriptional regulator DNA-binding domain-containing protein [Muribaculaceae bacterium]MCM1491815.1 LytTR family transcriptional regulator DNA-binding domain-containing protein [Muribaculaceae bacterium]
MKIRVEIDDNLAEEEILIRCRRLDEEALAIQKRINEAVNAGLKLAVTRGETEYYLSLSEILFFETGDNAVAVHTAGGIYTTRLRLYELEELLPGSFLRASKSAIINTGKVRSLRKNIAGASEVEFYGSSKRAFVSRNYFKLLMDKLEEKRLKR